MFVQSDGMPEEAYAIVCAHERKGFRHRTNRSNAIPVVVSIRWLNRVTPSIIARLPDPNKLYGHIGRVGTFEVASLSDGRLLVVPFIHVVCEGNLLSIAWRKEPNLI
jgi:hypothetical protein